jgi:diacylglycerol kinase family enzyme
MAVSREVLLCINRSSGSADRGDDERDKIAAAFEGTGIVPRVELCAGGGIAEHAERAVAEGADLIIVGGGDGSISAAAGALGGTRTALGILPLGTLNHFARDLGIPFDLAKAAQIIAAGQQLKVDLAEVNGRTFINNSAIGLYPLMVVSRDLQRAQLGRSRRLAMLVASARTLVRFGHQRLTLTVNEQKSRVDTPLLFVGNNDYRLDLGAPGRRDSIQDGRLCVFVMRKKTRRGFLAATARALLNRTRADDMVRLDDVERLRVDSRRSHLTVSLDGEVVRAVSPLDYRIRKQALGVIGP